VTETEFVKCLVGAGLSVVASGETMVELAARHGVRRWFDFADVVDLPPASLFAEQRAPFFFHAERLYALPPNELCCEVNVFDDGPRTHAWVRERLTALLGEGRSCGVSNTLGDRWEFGGMSLETRTFLRSATSGHNPLYQRHPELWNLCQITINRGWVQPLRPGEAERIVGASRRLELEAAILPPSPGLADWERGFLRRMPENKKAYFWSEGGEVGWRAGVWATVFAREYCLGLRHQRLYPARGGGGAYLELEMRNPFGPKPEMLLVQLLRGNEMQSLDRIAASLSRFWDLPLQTDEYPDE
jgi:hypothetical protein